MIYMFIGSIAFSFALIAFGVGAALTIWASSNTNQYREINAAKFIGYFVAILAMVALTGTSYFLAQSFVMQKNAAKMMMQAPGMDKMKMHKKGKHGSKHDMQKMQTPAPSQE